MALLRIYKDLDVKCKYFATCQQTVKMCDLEKHESNCNLPKCVNYDICKNNVKSVTLQLPSFLQNSFSLQKSKELVCEPACLILSKVKECGKDYKKMRQVLEEQLKNFAGSSPSVTIPTSCNYWLNYFSLIEGFQQQKEVLLISNGTVLTLEVALNSLLTEKWPTSMKALTCLDRLLGIQ